MVQCPLLGLRGLLRLWTEGATSRPRINKLAKHGLRARRGEVPLGQAIGLTRPSGRPPRHRVRRRCRSPRGRG